MQLPTGISLNPTWIFPKEDYPLLESIIKEFKIHPITAQVLLSRNLKDPKDIHDYLYAKLPDLLDPFLMAEMPKAVDRIITALENKENILIYGDNDVDGMTGTALLTEFLRFIGANVFFYVSTRGMDRKSLIIETLGYALENNCRLLITVDCGITAANEIAKVVEKEIDVIITDHHVPTAKIPHCIATLNPKLLNNPYPNKELTGVGVAFKLAHALTNQLVSDEKIPPKKVDLKRYLDLVALGTIADMGVLQGENRILVRYGLKQLRKGKRVGLVQLAFVADVVLSEITTFEVASKLAPRLNSLGRIDNPQKGVEMLLTRNPTNAQKLAYELHLNNLERQKIEKKMAVDAEKMLLEHPEIATARAIILASKEWHPGIVAILSTRICKQYSRPTVIIAIENGVGKGSLRSIPEFPLLGVLQRCSDLLLNFGGHNLAAGLTLKEENIPLFTQQFMQAAHEKLHAHDVLNKLHIDAAANFHDLTFDLLESFSLLEPFGNGNPPPILYTKAKQTWPPKIFGKSHLKLYLEDNKEGGRMLEGIAFGKAPLLPKLKQKNLPVDVAFTPQTGTFQGPSIQLLIYDLKI